MYRLHVGSAEGARREAAKEEELGGMQVNPCFQCMFCVKVSSLNKALLRCFSLPVTCEAIFRCCFVGRGADLKWVLLLGAALFSRKDSGFFR